MTNIEYFEELMKDEIIGEQQLLNAFKTGEIKNLVLVEEKVNLKGNIWRTYNVNNYYKIEVLFKK